MTTLSSRAVLALLTLCGAASVRAAEGSKISRVVVYPDRAQVTRTASVACGARAAALFESLPPAADPKSLRAQAGAARVEGIDLEEKGRDESYAPKAAALQAEIRAAEADEARQSDALKRAQQVTREARALGAVASQQVSRELAQPAPDLKQWSAALDQSLQARLDAATKAGEAQIKLRELGRKLDGLRRKLDAWSQAAGRSERSARVLVSCPAGQTAHVELTYLVGGASWDPAYEARAKDTAAGTTGQVELSLYATVAQRTGEDWRGAQLTFSTAIPRQDATPPELVPLRVYADPRAPPQKVLVRREEEVAHADSGGAQAGETGGPQVKSQGLSVQFVTEEPGDVPGDGSPARLLLARSKLPASFALKTAPALLPFVHRAAALENTAPFPLLAGPIDLFRAGGLAGHAELERVAQGAKFELSFGLEEQVKVKRLVLEEIGRDTGVFTKGKRYKFAYAYEVQSFLPGATTVELADRVPVSELDDVVVALDEQTSAGYALDKEAGIVRWPVKLGAGEKQRVELRFHVEVPSSYGGGL
jgi:uncharacterized protein (TIGR02231 family)